MEFLHAVIDKNYTVDEPLALGDGEIYAPRFADGEELLCERSPHITMGNLLVAKNKYVPEIEKYFNLGVARSIVCVNAIQSNLQQRLNGCDYDSNSMLITNNAILLRTAKENYDNFPVPYCDVPPGGKVTYTTAPEDLSELDVKISENKIGEIVNLSQFLNSLYWDKLSRGEREGLAELYADICKLAVLSGMEIDKAKRNFDVAAESALRTMRAKYGIEKLPEFFKFIMYTLEEKRFDGEIFSYDTTMDYLIAETRHFIRSVSKDTEDKIPLASFVKSIEKNGFVIKSGTNDARDCEYIKQYVRRSCLKIGDLRAGMGALEDDEKYLVHEEIKAIYSDAIGYVTEKLRNYYMLKSLLKDIDDNFSIADNDYKKFYWILFETLCLEGEHFFYEALSMSRDSDMYDLVPDKSGEIEIYGVKHSKKLSKSARI
jgi:hypothetical protein